MAGIAELAAILGALWRLVEVLEAGQSFREQRRDARFEKKVAKAARRVLEGQGSVEARAAARLLGDPIFAAFAADPDDPARFDALSAKAKTGDGLKGLLGPGTDEDAAFRALAEAWVAAALANATPAEKLIAAQQGVTDDTLLQLIRLALDSHEKQDQAQRQLVEALTRLRVDPSRLVAGDPFVAQDVDLTAFKMASDVTDDTVPSYVPRDIDPRLDQFLTATAGGGGPRFVAVAGPVKSGKTRCLLEALARVVPSHLVYRLRRAKGRDALNDLLTEFAINGPPGPWIVLVDDLYPHLADTALTAAVGRAADLDPPGIVVATIDAKALYLTKSDLLTDDIDDVDIDIVKGRHVELPRQASAAEHARAKFLLGDAIARADGNEADLTHFPERLAAVPELRARLRQAQAGPATSNCHALMLAAAQRALALGDRRVNTVDVRELARCIHRYLEPHEREAGPLTEGDLDDAQQWASARVGAAYGLLTPISGTDDHLELLDVVLDDIGFRALDPRFGPCTDPPDATGLGAAASALYGDLPRALQWTRSAADQGYVAAMFNLGLLLKEQGRQDHAAATEADEWWRQAADAGETRAMVNLGNMLRERGDAVAAERWWRQAADAGDIVGMANLGALLKDRGSDAELVEAERWYRQAALAGSATAMFNLGIVLEERGDLADAEDWWRRAANAGDPEAANNVGALLSRQGDAAAAEAWFRVAAEAGVPNAMNNLGFLLMKRGGRDDTADAEHWLRRSTATGHSPAMVTLGLLLEQRGQLDEAEAAYRDAIATTDPDHAPMAMVNLGHLQASRGRPDEAEAAYRDAIATTHPDQAPRAMVGLGHLQASRGRPDEAEAAYRDAMATAHPGHSPTAMVNLGNVLLGRGTEQGRAAAEDWWRQAAEAGHPAAMNNVGALSEQRGSAEARVEAEEWYRRAADAGYADGMYNLGRLLAERGSAEAHAEAEDWYRRAADVGSVSAMTHLGILLAERGTEDARGEAEDLWRRAADAGDTNAMYNLGRLLAERDTAEARAEAQEWYRRAADGGSVSAMVNLGAMLFGDRGTAATRAEAEVWWRRAADAGHAGAMFNLAALLETHDTDEAEDWYRRSGATDPRVAPLAREAIARMRRGPATP